MDKNEDVEMRDESQQIKAQESLISGKVCEMQESVEVYERLKLKAEFKYAYRMLMLLLLQAGDFNALSRQMMRFVGDACIGVSWDEDPPTKIETIMMMTRLWNGEAAYDKAKEKGIIIRCGDGILACGLSKPHVF